MTIADLAALRLANQQAGFNRWAGFDVHRAEPGRVELRLDWRPEFGQFSGTMHAGLMAALLDTAAGYAAATVAGNVTASHYAVRCLRPGIGRRFRAIGQVVKSGRRQVFCNAELHAEADGRTALIATADVLLVPLGDAAAPPAEAITPAEERAARALLGLPAE